MDDKLSFMYGRISMSKWNLNFWFSVEGFKNELTSMVERGETIDNIVVYKIANRIYREKLKARDGSGFDFETAQRGLYQLKQAIDKLPDGYTNAKERLGFLFKKISMPKPMLAYWLTVPEFLNKINDLAFKGVTIDNELVYEIMKEIYARKDAEGNKDFKFRIGNRSLKQLEKVLGMNREKGCDVGQD